MPDTHAGGCFCEAVETEVSGAPIEMGYCHCRSCRSYSGAPVSTFMLWPAGSVRVTKGEEHLGGYNKSGFSHRRFCTRCGGHLFVEHPTLGLADVHAAQLPGISFEPAVHLHYAQTVLPMKDGLPKFRDFPAEAGGSGEMIAE